MDMNNKRDYIEFDRRTWAELKVKYKRALQGKHRTFNFRDREIDTQYARYILEFLRPTYEKKGRSRLED
jgi:hypothetical protein